MVNSKQKQAIFENNRLSYCSCQYYGLVFLSIIIVTFYIMNTFTPLRCDDLIYQFQWLSERVDGLREPVDLKHKVSNVSEVFCSQVNHYQVMNGRFVVHFIVQCFCGFIGKPVFDFVNSFVYLLFVIGCIRLLNLKRYCFVLLSVLWLGLPIQYIFYYSISFAVNYLWPSTTLVFFFILLNKSVQNRNSIKRIHMLFVFFFSLFMGSLHEGFSLPLSGAMFLYILTHRKTVNYLILTMSIGLWLGTASVVLAPGTIGRGASSLSCESLSSILLMKLDVLRYSKRLYLLISAMILMYFVDRTTIKEFVKNRFVELCFIGMDFCFVLLVPHYSQRIEFPLELLSLLMFVEILIRSVLWIKKELLISISLLFITTIHIFVTIYYVKQVSVEYNEMLHSYMESPQGVTRYHNLPIPKPFNSYVKRLDDGIEREYISFTNGKEMVIEK